MKSSLIKTFVYCVIILIVFYALTKDVINTRSRIMHRNFLHGDKDIRFVRNEENSQMFYILQWTSPKNVPFVSMGENREGFIDRNCPDVNCVVTSNKSYLGDYTKFDVIAFAGPELSIPMYEIKLPSRRSPHQKYVFASIESSYNYPICSNRLDGFFNWTWTYKLDSEVQWGYIVVRDSDKKIIGPKREMHWLKLQDMNPVSEELKEQIKSKSKAAAWFVSNCYSRSKREEFAEELQTELDKYNLVLDIYGDCGSLQCSRDNEARCDKKISGTYYFYLAFENAFSEDYVTEKILHALHNNAVPIVYGGANYTRFMPDGIYLNARDLGVEKLAAKMNELINDPEKYAEYFRWKQHYSYHKTTDSAETNEYCRMCSLLNQKELMQQTSGYQNFHEWWDPPYSCSTDF